MKINKIKRSKEIQKLEANEISILSQQKQSDPIFAAYVNGIAEGKAARLRGETLENFDEV